MPDVAPAGVDAGGTTSERVPLHPLKGVSRSGFYDVEACPAVEDDFFYQLVGEGVRRNFVHRVYAIAAALLIPTAVFAIALVEYAPFARVVGGLTMPLFSQGTVLTLLVCAAFSFVPSLRRTFPANYALLLVAAASQTAATAAFVVDLARRNARAAAAVETALAVAAVAVAALAAVVWGTRLALGSAAAVAAVAAAALAAGAATTLKVAGPSPFSLRGAAWLVVIAAAAVAFVLYDWYLLFGAEKIRFHENDHAGAALHVYVDTMFPVARIFVAVVAFFIERRRPPMATYPFSHSLP